LKTLAAVLREAGRSTPYATSKPLEIEELEVGPVGPGEVLVQISHAGVCHSDLSVINGTRLRGLPLVMGHEASGIVMETGSNVRRLNEGDHVVFSFVPPCGSCAPCIAGRPALCRPGNEANGAGTLLSGSRRFTDAGGHALNHHSGVSAFSQYVVAAEESLIVVDNGLPLQEAALFGCAVITGVGAVFNSAQARPGSSLAVFGLGGVGLSAIMGARAAGANPVIAVDIVGSKLQLAKTLGATHTVNPTETDAVEAIRDITGGGADTVVESVGNEKVLVQAYSATGRGGTTVAVGLPHPDRQFSVPAISLVAEEKTVRGSYMGSAVPKRDVPRYIAMYQAGQLPVDKLLTGTLGLDAINDGMDRLADGSAVRQMVDLSLPLGSE
jgi:alcohol dehydrogenase